LYTSSRDTQYMIFCLPTLHLLVASLPWAFYHRVALSYYISLLFVFIYLLIYLSVLIFFFSPSPKFRTYVLPFLPVLHLAVTSLSHTILRSNNHWPYFPPLRSPICINLTGCHLLLRIYKISHPTLYKLCTGVLGFFFGFLTLEYVTDGLSRHDTKEVPLLTA